MKPATYQTLEAWQVQRARTARLEREEVTVPLWVRLTGRIEVLALIAGIQLACLWYLGDLVSKVLG